MGELVDEPEWPWSLLFELPTGGQRFGEDSKRNRKAGLRVPSSWRKPNRVRLADEQQPGEMPMEDLKEFGCANWWVVPCASLSDWD